MDCLIVQLRLNSQYFSMPRLLYLVDAPGLDKPAILYTLPKLSEEKGRKVRAQGVTILGLCDTNNTRATRFCQWINCCMVMPACLLLC